MKRIFAILAMIVVATASYAQGYRVKPGDTLQVEVLEDASLNRTVLVLPDGSFSFPLAGTVRASGRSLPEIQSALATALSPNFAASPTVFVGLSALAEPRVVSTAPVEPATIAVYVVGEVPNPGKFEVEPGTRILQLFAEVGGFTKFAATKRVQLRRTTSSGGERLYSINYRAIERGAQLQNNITVHDGDTIIVPTRRLFE